MTGEPTDHGGKYSIGADARKEQSATAGGCAEAATDGPPVGHDAPQAGRPALASRPSAWLRAALSSGAEPSIRQSSATRYSPSTRRTTVSVLPAATSLSLTIANWRSANAAT